MRGSTEHDQTLRRSSAGRWLKVQLIRQLDVVESILSSNNGDGLLEAELEDIVSMGPNSEQDTFEAR